MFINSPKLVFTMFTPKVIIPKNIWGKMIEDAKNFDGALKAFGLFSERRSASKRDYIITDFKKIDVEIIKENSSSGPIFRFRSMKDKGFYPTSGAFRYCGTILIQKNLDMTLHYAYWMGREQIDININLFFDKSKNIPIYKAFWATTNNTHGEFVPIDVIIS